MRKFKKRRVVYSLDRMNAEQRRVFEEMYSHGVSLREIAEQLTQMLDRPVSHMAVGRFARERIQREAERAARLQQHAQMIARALGSSDCDERGAKALAALHAIFFKLLNDSSDQNLTDIAREMRELEKVHVARERVAVEQKKVQISQKQLELKNRELEARLAAGREALAQVEQAVTRGHSTLPADVLAKLKEAYGIN